MAVAALANCCRCYAQRQVSNHGRWAMDGGETAEGVNPIGTRMHQNLTWDI